MISEWSVKRMYEIANINPRESLKKGTTAKKVPMDQLIPFCRDIPTYQEAIYEGGSKFRNGDTIMARITPCLENGKIAKVNIFNENEIGFGSTEYIVFRAKDNVNEDYLYYLVCSSIVRDPAIQSMVGSSGRQRVQIDVLQNLEILVPSKEEQNKIGSILKAIDDKIDINTKINRNLSEQAKALFEEELLKFDSVPDGWKEGSLIDIADYLNGLAMQKFRPSGDENGLPVLKIKELRQGYCDANSDLCSPNIKQEYIIHDGDVIFSWSGSLLVDFWCGGECGLNQHLFKVTSKKYDKWFYYAWTLYHLDRFIAVADDKATTMGHIKREELSKAEILIPDSDSYKRIGEVLGPLYDMIISKRVENRKLAALRDELLPKLMSGEIDVLEVEL